MNPPTSILRRAARKWGRRLYQWGSQQPTPTAIVYVVDFTTSSNTSTTGHPTVRWDTSNN